MKIGYKKGICLIMIAVIIVVITLGIVWLDFLEPLKAQEEVDLEQTTTIDIEKEKAASKYDFENPHNYTLNPNFSELYMNLDSDDYEFPTGWVPGIGNSSAYNFISSKLPFTDKYQRFQATTLATTNGKPVTPSRFYWQLNPTGGMALASLYGTNLMNKSVYTVLAQEFTTQRYGGTKLFYYMNFSRAFMPNIPNTDGKTEIPPAKIGMTLNMGGLKFGRGSGNTLEYRYNLDGVSSYKAPDGELIKLSIPWEIADFEPDGLDHFGSVTLEPEDLAKVEKYTDSKMKLRIRIGHKNMSPMNAIKLNYAQVIQAALFVEKPLQLKVPVGTDVTYLKDKDYFKSLIPADEIMVFTDETGATGKPLKDYEKATFEVEDVQIDNTYTNTVTQDEGRTSFARISAVVDGKKLFGIVSFQLKVEWGETLAFGGTDTFPAESAIAFSLVKNGDQYEVVQNFGDGRNAQNYPFKYNTKVEYFKQPTDGKETVIEKTTKADTSIDLYGNHVPADQGRRWGENGRQKVSLGDILRVTVSNPGKEWLYQQNEKIFTASVLKYVPTTVYYVITEKGFQPLPLNQVKAKTSIPIDWKTPVEVLKDRFNHHMEYCLLTDPNPIFDYNEAVFTGEFLNGPKTDVKNKTVDSELVVTAKMIGSNIAIRDTLKPTFKVGSTAFEPWLPTYSKWKDSMTESISKANAFTMMFSDKTQPVYGEGKTSPEIAENIKHRVYGKIPSSPSVSLSKMDTIAYPTNKGEQYITFSNVGFYQGKPVYVKMCITPEHASGQDEKSFSYIGIKGKDFLSVSLDNKSKSANVRYEFQDEHGNPLKLNGYWTLDHLNNSNTSVTLPVDKIQSIYSTSREYQQDKIQVKYRLVLNPFGDGEGLELSGSQTAGSKKATVLYSNETAFKFKMSSGVTADAGFAVQYFNGTDAKVEIPDPQEQPQVFDTITSANYPDTQGKITQPLNYQFMQQIPYESEKNRNQQIKWQLPEIGLSSIDELDSWSVVNELGRDVSSYFQFDQVKRTIEPLDYKNADLYNHYYTFMRQLKINEKEPIREDLLQPKDGQGRFLDYTGQVALQVDNQDPVRVSFHSYINFAAKAEFESVYRDIDNKIEKIPDSEISIENDLLITHKYKKRLPEKIDGYTPTDESIPIDYTQYPVRYTGAKDNRVQFIYKSSKGELLFDIPDFMDFTDISVPSIGLGKTEYLQSVDPNWRILVTDTRSGEQRKPYKLSAKLADQSFQEIPNREYQVGKEKEYKENVPLISSILRFSNEKGEVNDLSQSVIIYDTGEIAPSHLNYPIQWVKENTGFFLDLQAYQHYPLGKYKATIDFTIEYVE